MNDTQHVHIISNWLLEQEEIAFKNAEEKERKIQELEKELKELKETTAMIEADLEKVNTELKEIEAEKEESRMPISVIRSRPFLRHAARNASSAPLLASFGLKSKSDIVYNASAWSFSDKGLLVSQVEQMQKTSGL